MKSKVRGFNLSDTSAFNFCCATLSDGIYPTIASQNDFNRAFDRRWPGSGHA
jgi:hypothetical protein